MSTGNGQDLFARVGYDPRAELRAMDRLRRHDLAGCRRALEQLAGGLRIPEIDGDATTVIQLLADLLQRVNRGVYRGAAHATTCQRNRLAIIRRFSACASPLRARQHFLSLVEDWLGGAPAESTGHLHVERAIRLLETEFRTRVSLSSVAQRLAVSPSYLSRLFRRETGVTLTSYLQRIRLRHAMVLLSEQGRSCAEIAYEVGYQNYRDFYRNLVKYERVSPRALRRRLRDSSRTAGAPPLS